MRNTFVILTDTDIETIRRMHYNGELRLQRYVNPKTHQPVDEWKFLPLMAILKKIYFQDHDEYLIVDEIDAARRLSAALKNKSGEYAAVVIGAVADAIVHYFKNGEPLGEHIPKESHIVLEPEQPLVKEKDFEIIKIPDELFRFEDGLHRKSQNQK